MTILTPVDDQLPKLLSGLKIPRETDLEFAVLRFDPARRQLDVLATQSIFYIGHG